MSTVVARPPIVPDERGRFGTYGGRYVPEVLIPALDELASAWRELRDDPGFRGELGALLRDFVGRPTPITHARRLSDELGYDIWLKREDLAHTGAHKINNALGQALLAKRLGKERIIAETGAGQHGVAAATACALLGLPCVVYMGEEDTHRQAPNVARMKLLGAEVVPVMAGTRTLKEAVNEALRDWAASVRTTHYIIGSVVGPHPFPLLVRDLQRVIGDEARAQFADVHGVDPQVVVACVGGGSNAIGMFTAFVGMPGVELIGVEAGGRGRSWVNTAPRSRRVSPASCTGRSPTCSRTRTVRSPKRTRSRRGSTTREWVPSTRSSTTAVSLATSRPPTGRRSQDSRRWRGARGSSRHSSRRT